MAKSGGAAEYWYQAAQSEYESARDLEEVGGNEEKIDASWGLASGYFWFSLVLGHPKAPYALYKIFGQGLGPVKKDEYLASLMFGVAEKLKDPECDQGMRCRDMRDSALNKQINILHSLIVDTQRKNLPVDDEEMTIVCQQMDIFRDAIKLPSTYTKTIDELLVPDNLDDPSSSSQVRAEPPSQATIEWQEAGGGIKVANMIIGGISYGKLTEQEITHTFQFRVNNQHVTISKYRSVTFPDSIKSGEEYAFAFPLKQPNGDNIKKSDEAYLVIKYNSDGQLEEMVVPTNPAISYNDDWAPALVGYHGHIYTLPVSSGHYSHLSEVLRHNGKHVEITYPGVVLQVQPVVSVAPSIHQVQAPGTHGTNYVNISGDVQLSEESCCCILM